MLQTYTQLNCCNNSVLQFCISSPKHLVAFSKCDAACNMGVKYNKKLYTSACYV